MEITSAVVEDAKYEEDKNIEDRWDRFRSFLKLGLDKKKEKNTKSDL